MATTKDFADFAANPHETFAKAIAQSNKGATNVTVENVKHMKDSAEGVHMIDTLTMDVCFYFGDTKGPNTPPSEAGATTTNSNSSGDAGTIRIPLSLRLQQSLPAIGGNAPTPTPTATATATAVAGTGSHATVTTTQAPSTTGADLASILGWAFACVRQHAAVAAAELAAGMGMGGVEGSMGAMLMSQANSAAFWETQEETAEYHGTTAAAAGGAVGGQMGTPAYTFNSEEPEEVAAASDEQQQQPSKKKEHVVAASAAYLHPDLYAIVKSLRAAAKAGLIRDVSSSAAAEAVGGEQREGGDETVPSRPAEASAATAWTTPGFEIIDDVVGHTLTVVIDYAITTSLTKLTCEAWGLTKRESSTEDGGNSGGPASPASSSPEPLRISLTFHRDHFLGQRVVVEVSQEIHRRTGSYLGAAGQIKNILEGLMKLARREDGRVRARFGPEPKPHLFARQLFEKEQELKHSRRMREQKRRKTATASDDKTAAEDDSKLTDEEAAALAEIDALRTPLLSRVLRSHLVELGLALTPEERQVEELRAEEEMHMKSLFETAEESAAAKRTQKEKESRVLRLPPVVDNVIPAAVPFIKVAEAPGTNVKKDHDDHCAARTNLATALVGYLEARLETLTGFCVVCDAWHAAHQAAATPVVAPQPAAKKKKSDTSSHDTKSSSSSAAAKEKTVANAKADARPSRFYPASALSQLMARSTVCTRGLCVFRFQSLDVGRNAAAALAVDTVVMDALIAFTRCAIISQRWERILSPFPVLCDAEGKVVIGRGLEATAHAAAAAGALTASAAPIDPADAGKSLPPSFTNDEQKAERLKDIAKLREMVTGWPSTKDLMSGRAAPVMTYLDNALLNWIRMSCGSYIRRIENSPIKFMDAAHQFIFMQSTQTHAKAFEELKKSGKKTVYAFHGSRHENWHSIIRNGLINASGTAFQVNGAAYGSGIYLSPAASVSYGYSGMSTYARSLRPMSAAEEIDRNGLHCIAICEVIEESIMNRERGSDIWVQPHSSHVMTRFFFVFNKTNIGGGDVRLTDKDTSDQLDAAVALMFG